MQWTDFGNVKPVYTYKIPKHNNHKLTNVTRQIDD